MVIVTETDHAACPSCGVVHEVEVEHRSYGSGQVSVAHVIARDCAICGTTIGGDD